MHSNMHPFRHGGDVLSYCTAERHTPPLDFSANTSPLGFPLSGMAALIRALPSFSRYPDPYSRRLRAALAEAEHADAGCIASGNGAGELIYAAVQAVKPHRVLIVEPAFSEYRRAAARIGGGSCAVESFVLTEQTGFCLTGELCELLCSRIAAADMVFACSPSNPCGTIISERSLARIARACGTHGAFFFLDGCFMPFVSGYCRGGVFSLLDGLCRFAAVKAFTKFYGMAGLRLGYAVCSDTQTADMISGALAPWSVSCAAQAAGQAVLRDTRYAENVRRVTARERQFLCSALDTRGIPYIRGNANFLLCRSPEGGDIAAQLLAHGILVRSCADFAGLDSRWFRIAVRRRRDNKKLINALTRILNA